MYTHITNDIKFDDSIEISKSKKKELLEEFVTNNMDKELFRELKTSIGSDTNSDNSSDSSNSPIFKSEDSNEKNINKPNIPLNINVKEKNISLSNLYSGDNKLYKNHRKISKKNVHNLSNFLQLSKTNNDNQIENNFFEKNLSDNDIQNMFNGIVESCDSIINDKNNIPCLDIDVATKSFDNLDNTSFIPVIQEEDIKIEFEIKQPDPNI